MPSAVCELKESPALPAGSSARRAHVPQEPRPPARRGWCSELGAEQAGPLLRASADALTWVS